MDASGTCNMWLHLACADASEPKRNIGTSLSTCGVVTSLRVVACLAKVGRVPVAVMMRWRRCAHVRRHVPSSDGARAQALLRATFRVLLVSEDSVAQGRSSRMREGERRARRPTLPRRCSTGMK
jgi:hypothetical protein